ncbi:MAG: outer membrane beta-barrel protein [Patiriisocius sp.]|uniref:outer membrane beta-barrel protein n=1 Tax=Patiriisocius sp. TaxID=2822396 RepID=UPI003EFAA634
MKEKKNIDQLFKERFEQFEATPLPHVWENIQAQLQEKKKDRKVIPLWWKVAGVAALLALMFTIGNSVWDINNNNTIVNGDSNNTETIKQENNHSPLIDTDKQILENKNTQEIVENNNEENLKKIKGSSEISNSETTSSTQNEVVTNNPKKSQNFNNTSVAVQKNKNSEKTQNKTSIVDSNKTNNAVAVQDQKNSANKKDIQNPSLIKEGVAINTSVEKDKNQLINKSLDSAIKKDNESIISETGIAQETISEEKKIDNDATKKSIFDAIDEQNKINSEAIAQKEAIKNRWEVAPNFAPVYYNSLSQGSSIDASFADNSQNGDVNFSYGVGVSYTVSDRLSIRTGVSNVDLSYSTGGIELGNGPISAALRSVDYDNSQSVLIPQDTGTFAASNDGSFGDISPKSTNGEAFLNQNISYYEVPLELKYALFNTKLGVNVIGGLSTLFLGNNKVSVTAGDFNETLGEANNLSNVSFSTNVGLGFDYKLSSKFKFNVEPMFKYQLNPYTDSSVNFRPYYIGVYTGLSFKF